MTRAEHVRWCKQRAREYLPHDPSQAVTSMLSDLRKHPETSALIEGGTILALGTYSMSSAIDARKFIDGFAE